MATVGASRRIASPSSTVRTGRRISSHERRAGREAQTAPKRWTKIVFGPSALIESRSDVSKPRMSEVMPTIDVTPMTTPSTVSAERILLPRSVPSAISAVSQKQRELLGEDRHGYSRRSASIGSSIAARRAG